MTRSDPAHIPDLRARRRSAGLTQQTLASLADVSIATVGFIERSPAMADRLLAALSARSDAANYETAAAV